MYRHGLILAVFHFFVIDLESFSPAFALFLFRIISITMNDNPSTLNIEKMKPHKWKFYRCGGVDQVALATGEDLKNLKHLDKKLWMALAMPTRGAEFDPITADILDTDKDGRIRPPEILDALEWSNAVLYDIGELLRPSNQLALSAIKDASIEAGARRILADLGKPNADSISFEDLGQRVLSFERTVLNGDGVIIPTSSNDPDIQQTIADIVKATGGTVDRSGNMGVDKKTLERFTTEAQAYITWVTAAAEASDADLSNDVIEEATKSIELLKSKIDDYFARCRLLDFDERATNALNPDEKFYAEISSYELTPSLRRIADMPLAFVEKNKPLPLKEGINPAWDPALQNFIEVAVKPILGKELKTLTETEWLRLQSEVAPFQSRVATKPITGASEFSVDRLKQILSESTTKEIKKLIKKDAALAPEYAQLTSVEKIVRFKRTCSNCSATL